MAALALASGGIAAGLRYNGTSSYPVGFYLSSSKRVHPPADEFRAAQAAAQGRADVTGFQGASSHFRQHWRKQQRVGLTDERDHC